MEKTIGCCYGLHYIIILVLFHLFLYCRKVQSLVRDHISNFITTYRGSRFPRLNIFWPEIWGNGWSSYKGLCSSIEWPQTVPRLMLTRVNVFLNGWAAQWFLSGWRAWGSKFRTAGASYLCLLQRRTNYSTPTQLQMCPCLAKSTHCFGICKVEQFPYHYINCTGAVPPPHSVRTRMCLDFNSQLELLP